LHYLGCAGKYAVPSTPSTARLKQLVKLSERKEKLLAELQNIDRSMIRLEQEFRETRRHKNKKAKLTFSGERTATRGKRQARSKRRGAV